MFFHVDFKPGTADVSQGLQFEIDCTLGQHTGGIYGDGRAWIVWPTPENEIVVRRDDWNEYLVKVEGNRYISRLNGVPMIDFTDPKPKSFDGPIALQLHSGGRGNMLFKEIYIRDLIETVKLYYSDQYEIPLPPGHKFPIRKYRLLREALQASGAFEFVPAPLASPETIELVHNPEYVRGFCGGYARQRRHAPHRVSVVGGAGIAHLGVCRLHHRRGSRRFDVWLGRGTGGRNASCFPG